MRRLSLVFIILLAATGTGLYAQTPQASTAMVSEADAAAIKQTALDYIEGWYEGNAERMQRALHPELAKRIVQTDPKTGYSRLSQMSAMTLTNNTRAGGGSKTPKEKQQKDITILDVYQNAACVKIIASDWIDYLQMAKSNGKWVIVNVLWELKPVAK